MKTKFFLLVLNMLIFSGCLHQQKVNPPRKFAVILQADTDRHEGLARVVHALMYSKELLEAGYEVVLIFDGAGTGWALKLREPENKLHKLFVELQTKGIVEEICDYCSNAFHVKEKLMKKPETPFKKEYNGHPSIVKWINKGYELIIL